MVQRVLPASISQVRIGGSPETPVYGPVSGGTITNPYTAADQGIATAEPLFVDMVGPAALTETATTFRLDPGYSFQIPANLATDVSVNAETNGHRFSTYVVQPGSEPPTPIPSSFPPAGPVTLTNAIPSYLYQEYSDDDDLQAFVRAYNDAAQYYAGWFAIISLPVYTNPQIFGALLDWVAHGLYGIVRPSLSSGQNKNIGPLNTFLFNELVFDGHKVIGPSDVVATSDDVFKRIITWNFYKGDGNQVNVRWLKRRIMRFSEGVNGTAPNIDETYPISVIFGLDNQVNINLGAGFGTLLGGALFNSFALNSIAFDDYSTKYTPGTPISLADVIKEGIDAGVLQLPFQYDYVVTVRT